MSETAQKKSRFHLITGGDPKLEGVIETWAERDRILNEVGEMIERSERKIMEKMDLRLSNSQSSEYIAQERHSTHLEILSLCLIDRLYLAFLTILIVSAVLLRPALI